MRRIARRLGAEFTFAEVMLDRFVVEVSRGKKADRYLALDEHEHPSGAQLMGSDSRELVPRGPKAGRIGVPSGRSEFRLSRQKSDRQKKRRLSS